jgi:hypothetical protein
VEYGGQESMVDLVDDSLGAFPAIWKWWRGLGPRLGMDVSSTLA